MVENIQNRSWVFLTKVFAMVMILLLLLNTSFYFLLMFFNPNKGYLVVEHKWELLNNQEKKVALLVLGDSSGNQSFSVCYFENQTGLSALNLCTIGPMITFDDSWMLQKYIEKIGVPEKVLIIHVHDVWYRRFNQVLKSRIPLEEIQSKNYKPLIPNTFKESLTYGLHKYFPMYSQRQSISQLIMNPHSYKHNLVFDKGGSMRWDKPDSLIVRTNYNDQIDLVKRNDFHISKDNIVGINSLINLAEKYKFNLYFANSPEYDLLWEDKNFREYYYSMVKELSSICSKSKYAKFISEKPELFPIDQMAGTDHIITESAPDFTQKLINKMY